MSDGSQASDVGSIPIARSNKIKSLQTFHLEPPFHLAPTGTVSRLVPPEFHQRGALMPCVRSVAATRRPSKYAMIGKMSTDSDLKIEIG
jgi:hypothetical protein